MKDKSTGNRQFPFSICSFVAFFIFPVVIRELLQSRKGKVGKTERIESIEQNFSLTQKGKITPRQSHLLSKSGRNTFTKPRVRSIVAKLQIVLPDTTE